MTDEQFEDFLKRAAPEYRVPPGEPPREEMWRRIQARRAQRGRPGDRRTARWPWWAGMAAMLLLAFALGRASGPAPVPMADAGAGTAVEEDVAFRLAAADYLLQTDAFLSLFRVEAREARADTALGDWARDLLITARLMLDAPAATTDPALRELLQDLEMILADIARYVERQDRTELEFIEDGLDEGAVQLRLRATLTRDEETLGTLGVRS